MTPPRLTRRLRAALELVPEEATAVADVGAGHGALSAHLAATRSVIATEAQPGPYAELCRNLRAWSATDRVDAREGSGLAPLSEGEVDAVVVAGVSARTAQCICDAAAEKRVRWLVLQCVQHPEQVEPWLARRGWPVRQRIDVLQRGRTYATWLVEVCA